MIRSFSSCDERGEDNGKPIDKERLESIIEGRGRVWGCAREVFWFRLQYGDKDNAGSELMVTIPLRDGGVILTLVQTGDCGCSCPDSSRLAASFDGSCFHKISRKRRVG